MSMAFSPDQIIKACGYDKVPNPVTRSGLRRNVEANWPTLYDALYEFKCTDPLIQVGAIATVHTETGLFRPIHEMGGTAYLNAKYDTRTDLGNTPEKDGDGAKYAGEGYIQLTGKANYDRYGKKLGLDLVTHPELAMESKTAARILALFFIEARVREACLAKDWKLARKRVNGGYTHYDDVFKPCVDKLLYFLEH